MAHFYAPRGSFLEPHGSVGYLVFTTKNRPVRDVYVLLTDSGKRLLLRSCDTYLLLFPHGAVVVIRKSRGVVYCEQLGLVNTGYEHCHGLTGYGECAVADCVFSGLVVLGRDEHGEIAGSEGECIRRVRGPSVCAANG